MNRTGQVLVGCAVGCGVLLLASVGACIGFVSWLKRPGELLEPARLLDRSTLAHVEWTLRIEDPGTEQAFGALLEGIDRSRAAVPFLPEVLRRWSSESDERELRQLFPLTLTWSLRRGATGERDHLFAASVPTMGNRIRIADWFLGFAARRDGDLEQIEHAGEQIYRVRRNGMAFFIRTDGVFLTTDVDRAKSTVEALEQRTPGAHEAGELEELLAGLPETARLRGAAVNEDGACAAILGWLTGRSVEDAAAADVDLSVADVDLSTVHALTVAGGFTPSAAFEALLTVLSTDPRWGASHGERLASALAERLDAEVTPVDTATDPLVLRISIDDPAGALSQRLDRVVKRPDRRARR
jgi:hypothetical protein